MPAAQTKEKASVDGVRVIPSELFQKLKSIPTEARVRNQGASPARF